MNCARSQGRALLLTVMLLSIGFSTSACQNWFRGQLDENRPSPGLTFDTKVDTTADVVTTPPPDLTEAPGIGDACADLLACREGLACIDGACLAIGTSTVGQTCILSDECTEGLLCNIEGQCAPEGSGDQGALCAEPDGCRKELACISLGFFGTCLTSGTGDLGSPCERTRDCLGGLFCSSAGTCDSSSPFYGYAGWPGIACEKPQGVGDPCTSDEQCVEGLVCSSEACVDARPPRIFFELAPRDDGDFFRLPFPSDARRTDVGTVDLSAFPTAGQGLQDYDAVASLIDDAAENQRGFSTTPTVLFRFSHSMSLGSFRGKDTESAPATLRYVNIEADSVAKGYGPLFNWYVTTGGGRYVCPRWAAVRTAPETPLIGGEQYAVLLLDGVSTTGGEKFSGDDDLAIVLAPGPPTDEEHMLAWQQHAQLRAFLQEEGISTTDVVGAAVFTPDAPHATVTELRQAVDALPIPQPTMATLCADATQSPCDDGETGAAHVRGCVGSPPGVEEIHFRLELPVVQAGERPYESPDSGGHLFTQEGSAAIVATESVCVSMAVSSIQEMPSEGWPLIIVPPDIGDTYRTAVDRFGQLFSSLEHEGTATGAVVVSWEGPLHGERSASEHAPLARIHNYANPGAARGNVLQGVADLTELIRAASTLAWSAQESPTGEALSIDASRVALIGHGHGATLATLAAPVAPEVGLLVLSGAGADMMTTWLGQSDPVTTQLGAAVTLAELDADGPTELNRYHPALLRFGSFMNAVDPVNFAALLAKSPLTSTPRRHILNIHGIPDHTTSEGAARLYARRLGAPLVGDVLEEVSGLDAIEAPATETLGPEGAAVTAGTVQASAPDEASSHRVFFDDDAVRAQASGFVASWLTGNTPSIPARE